MKNNSQKITLFFSLILLIGLCLVFAFLYNKIDNNNKNAEIDMTAWQTEMNQLDKINSLERSVEQVADDKALLETHFVKSSDIVPFLDTIEIGPVIEADTAIDSVDTGPKNDQLIVEIKASGSFEAVYKFLTLLENSPYELDFLSMDMHRTTALDVSPKKIKSSSWDAIFKIQLLSYVP